MRKRFFPRFLFIMFSCIIVSSLIADLGNSDNEIVYEAEEFEDLCGGVARAFVDFMEADYLGMALAYCQGSAVAFGEIGQFNNGWYKFDVKAGIPEFDLWDDDEMGLVTVGQMATNDAGEYYVDGFSDFCGVCAISSASRNELMAEAKLQINSNLYTLLEGQWVKILYDKDEDYDRAP